MKESYINCDLCGFKCDQIEGERSRTLHTVGSNIEIMATGINNCTPRLYLLNPDISITKEVARSLIIIPKNKIQ